MRNSGSATSACRRWCPFRLQIYFNGHNQLAAKLKAAGVLFRMLDNAFTWIADLDKAQAMADDLDVSRLHAALDRFARLYCPVIEQLGVDYHWSLMQVEYSTDVIFGRQADLAPIYDAITRTAIHAVKAEHVATFLGRKLVEQYRDELGNDFSTRIEGTRIRHYMGPASIKMYDKQGIVLRIETTTNDVSFFKHHRKVEQRDGSTVRKLAPLKRTIYSLPDLRGLLLAANRRYLDFISDLGDPTAGTRVLHKVVDTVTENGRTYKGFNFFAPFDERLFEIIVRGEHTITGLRNNDLRRHLPGATSSQISRCLKRLRVHGLIKSIGNTYKYYVTELGRRVILTGLKLKELVLIPALSHA
jgi:hypothetical protein